MSGVYIRLEPDEDDDDGEDELVEVVFDFWCFLLLVAEAGWGLLLLDVFFFVIIK